MEEEEGLGRVPVLKGKIGERESKDLAILRAQALEALSCTWSTAGFRHGGNLNFLL